MDITAPICEGVNPHLRQGPASPVYWRLGPELTWERSIVLSFCECSLAPGNKEGEPAPCNQAAVRGLPANVSRTPTLPRLRTCALKPAGKTSSPQSQGRQAVKALLEFSPRPCELIHSSKSSRIICSEYQFSV